VGIAEYRFFHTINRLTVGQLRKIVEDAGFINVDILPVIGDWNDVSASIFSQSKEIYSTLTLTDLLAHNVWIFMKKQA